MNTAPPRTILNGSQAEAALRSIETASWIWHPDVPCGQAAILRFSVKFQAVEEPLTFHISADQRFSVSLNGTPIARGPDCGDPAHWPFSSYQLPLESGEHELTVEAWWIGDHAPLARMTHEGGFILKAEGLYDQQLTTGRAPWNVAICPEYSFQPWEINDYQAVGDQLCIDGRLRGSGRECKATVVATAEHQPLHGYFEQKWILTPATLPDQLSKPGPCGMVRTVHGSIPESDIQHLLAGKAPLTIPENTTLSFLCDLKDYYCAFPKVKCSGGLDAEIRWSWSEALFENDLKTKSNRNRTEGMHFQGLTDSFSLNGKDEQSYETLWWRAGRYIQLSIQTADEPLSLQSLEIEETRYPLENHSHFACNQPGIDALTQLCFRGLQCNSHETAFDCPYYEQLMYTGDTRLQVLIQYVTTRDDRLPRRCIELFNWSRASGCSGLTTSRYPDRDTQWIPPFSLIWIWMVHDYFYWRDDQEFVKQQLTGTRSVLNAFSNYLNADHLLENMPHWVFVDWTADWLEGYPPGAQGGISALVNLMYLQALEKATELETVLGNKRIAEIYHEQSIRTAQAILAAFWDSSTNMMADDTAHNHFSEHAQALTIACTSLDAATRRSALTALSAPPLPLTKVSIYFSFYVFEALLTMDEAADIRKRLEPWFQLADRGFKTPPEEFGHTRSDCHAWGSHPLYHFHAGILGVRPGSPGFKTVNIAPRDIGWKNISGTTIHPLGNIETTFAFSDNTLEGEIILPDGVAGTVEWRGKEITLIAGKNRIWEPRP